MIVMIPEPEPEYDNTSPVSKDSDEISFTRTRLYTPTSSIYSTDSEYKALGEGHHSTSNESETAMSKVHHDNTRQTTVTNTTDPIHGTYALFDSLSLSTTSGPIDVVIKINNQDEPPLGHSQSARVTISSDTGDIRVFFQGEDQHRDGDGNEHGMGMGIPREYAVDIRTGTGNIDGRIPLVSGILLRTTAGCIRAVLVPVITVVDGGRLPSILTASETGSQFVCVAEPVMLSGLGLGRGYGYGGIQASHVSAAGSLNIRYPMAWTGWVELRGGSNCLAGEGISRVCSGDGCVGGVKRQQQQHGQGKWWGSNDMGISLQTRGSAMFTV